MPSGLMFYFTPKSNSTVVSNKRGWILGNVLHNGVATFLKKNETDIIDRLIVMAVNNVY